MGDYNHVSNTSERRKPTQLNHINFLKLYKSQTPAPDYEMDSVSSNIKPCASNTTADLTDKTNSYILLHLLTSHTQDVTFLINKHQPIVTTAR